MKHHEYIVMCRVPTCTLNIWMFSCRFLIWLEIVMFSFNILNKKIVFYHTRHISYFMYGQYVHKVSLIFFNSKGVNKAVKVEKKCHLLNSIWSHIVNSADWFIQQHSSTPSLCSLKLWSQLRQQQLVTFTTYLLIIRSNIE